jgi:hypothetical protein
MINLLYLEVMKGPQVPKPSTCTCQSLVLGFLIISYIDSTFRDALFTPNFVIVTGKSLKL